MWKASVLTLYPELFPGPLDGSVIGRSRAKTGVNGEPEGDAPPDAPSNGSPQAGAAWSLETIPLRSFSDNRYGSIDDTPSGGGAGLVMRADILAKAIDSLTPSERPIIYLSPRGRPFDQAYARELADGPGVSLLCGRFEGVDARLLQARPIIEVSIGDFVLAGGEIAAMAMIEACVRLLPGVLGSACSLGEESFEDNLLEYPQFTRPQEFEGLTIPSVLTSGNHKKITDWRRQQAEEITRTRRPDLWERYVKNGPIRRIKTKERDQ